MTCNFIFSSVSVKDQVSVIDFSEGRQDVVGLHFNPSVPPMHSVRRQLKIRHFASCANNAQNVKFQSLRTSLTRSFEIFD